MDHTLECAVTGGAPDATCTCGAAERAQQQGQLPAGATTSQGGGPNPPAAGAGNGPADTTVTDGAQQQGQLPATPPRPRAPRTKAPARPPRTICDEIRERSVQIRSTTVIFRPGETLTGFKKQLASERGILTREQ